MSDLPIRFLAECGTRASLRVFWGDDCPNCVGGGGKGYHNAHAHLVDSNNLSDWELGGATADHPLACWPTKCDHCTATRPAFELEVPCSCGCGETKAVVTRQVFRETLYSAPSGALVAHGELVPGDAYLATWCDGEKGRCHNWDNCSGEHLVVMLPDRHPWDTAGRASNCTLKSDRSHRCWCVHGDPRRGEVVTVDKVGVTCHAGAGSIDSGTWHGFLTAGVLRRC